MEENTKQRPQDQTGPHDLAFAAIRQGMVELRRGAGEWGIADGDLASLEADFTADFKNTIKTLDDYHEWRALLERLFVHSGRMAAFLAEASRGKVKEPPGSVPKHLVVLALQIVKVALCYGRLTKEERELRAKVCKATAFMVDSELAKAKAVMKAALGFAD